VSYSIAGDARLRIVERERALVAASKSQATQNGTAKPVIQAEGLPWELIIFFIVAFGIVFGISGLVIWVVIKFSD